MATPEWIKAAADPTAAAEQLAARLLVSRELGPAYPAGGLPDWVKQAGPFDTGPLAGGVSAVRDAVTGAGDWLTRQGKDVFTGAGDWLHRQGKGIGLSDQTMSDMKPGLIGAGLGAGVGLVGGLAQKKKRPLSGALYGGLLGGLAGGLGGMAYNRMGGPSDPAKPSTPAVNKAYKAVAGPEITPTGEVIRRGWMNPDLEFTPSMPTSLQDAAKTYTSPLSGSLGTSVVRGGGFGGVVGYGLGKDLNKRWGDKVVEKTLGGTTVKEKLAPGAKIPEVEKITTPDTPRVVPRTLHKTLGGFGAAGGAVAGGLRNLYNQGQQAMTADVGTKGNLANKLQTIIANAPVDATNSQPAIAEVNRMIAALRANPQSPVDPTTHGQAAALAKQLNDAEMVRGPGGVR